MRSHSYINSSKHIIEKYKGEMPLSQWLKNFFSVNKKYGSRDRKLISELCYSYFRTGNLFQSLPLDERLIYSLFLTASQENFVLNELNPDWAQNVENNIDEKLSLIDLGYNINSLFPFNNKLSPEIDTQKFNRSLLIQPDVFLRIRPGKNKNVLGSLNRNNIPFTELSDNCLRISNSSPVDKIIKLDEEAVIQDLNSQKVMDLLKPELGSEDNIEVWDTCAASGGKSILFKDLYPHSILTVSDIRESILINLQKRFKRAGISLYNYFITDLSNSQNLPDKNFNVIICDAPCSGSGTWSRTPEQMNFFNYQKLDHYSNLQRSISLNSIENMKKNGYFMYITCSVFTAENEEVVTYIKNNSSLDLVNACYYKGYEEKADTLYTALFKA